MAITWTTQQEIRTVQSGSNPLRCNGSVVADYSIDMNDLRMPTNQVTDFHLTNDANLYFRIKEAWTDYQKINLNDGEISESTQKVKWIVRETTFGPTAKTEEFVTGSVNNFYMYGYQTVKYEDGKVKTFLRNEPR